MMNPCLQQAGMKGFSSTLIEPMKGSATGHLLFLNNLQYIISSRNWKRITYLFFTFHFSHFVI